MLTDREQARAGPRSMKTVGSPEWCWQTIDFFKDALRHVNEQFLQAEEVLKELEQVKAWERVPPEAPYGSFDAMLKAETGMSAQQLRKQLKTAREKYGMVPAAARNGEAGKGRSRNTGPTQASDTAESVVAVLKRDAPSDPAAADLLERVLDGEITPNAAAVQSGRRKKTVTVRIADPRLVANQLRKHMAPEQIAQLIALLLKEVDDP